MKHFGVYSGLLLVTLSAAVVMSQDVRVPPKISKFAEKVEQKTEILTGRTDESLTFVCEASGTPTPTYDWLRNDEVIDFSNSQSFKRDDDPTNGEMTLIVSIFTDGYYQCRAKNKFGVALSDKKHLLRAYNGFYSDTVRLEKHADEGEYMMMPCQPLEGFPTLTNSWKTDDPTNLQGSDGDILQLGNRIVMDDQGNLHFAYVKKIDEKWEDGKHDIYKCVKYNPVLDVSIGGSYTTLMVRDQGGTPEKEPLLRYWSVNKETQSNDDEVIVLEGDMLEMRCIFSGNPVPKVGWSREDGRHWDIGHTEQTDEGRRLVIKQLQTTDTGVYECEGSNSLKKVKKGIKITVKQRPRAEQTVTNRNSTIGDDVIFSCATNSEPAAEVTWYKNGEPLDDDDLPARMTISDDKKELSVKEVCKSCRGGLTDLSVFQCNATNDYGYVFGNAYLNVLEKTVITDPADPADIYISLSNSTAAENTTLYCFAESDPATPVNYQWTLNDTRLISSPPALTITGNTLVINLESVSTDRRDSLLGKYSCMASNGAGVGYSRDHRNFIVTRDGSTDRIVGALIGSWIIIIICVVVFVLLMIFCLVCCFTMNREQGEEYPVDVIERKRGNDPEKEIADNYYHEYQRPVFNTDTLKRSRAGFGSRASISSKRTLEDEEGLMTDGYLGPGSFNEDGSFIGQYDTMQSQRSRKLLL